ncbi:uncharacterized protein LOC108673819 [Hyalella azteca]|uniref:Uncharacterized protein LOC108673819 n=1 Tax=Hyalella azteca TaxID=294128 RepID=A0A8B7NW82_HYAAZ|nr:uncharacterized protein LOC108673819 [Hyalella azteca]
MKGRKKSLMDRTSLDLSWDASDMDDEDGTPRAENITPNKAAVNNNNTNKTNENKKNSAIETQFKSLTDGHDALITEDEFEDNNNASKNESSGQVPASGSDTKTSNLGSKVNELSPLYLYDTDESDELYEEASG